MCFSLGESRDGRINNTFVFGVFADPKNKSIVDSAIPGFPKREAHRLTFTSILLKREPKRLSVGSGILIIAIVKMLQGPQRPQRVV